MVTSHLPKGPLPWALPGPEGAVQGFHLCAGCRTGGTRRISPTPSWVAWGGALLLPIVKCLKCNAPPSLAEDRLSWHWGSQTGHQGHTEKANSLPVASPSTLGDQIHLMVKGLAGLAARISESWGPTVRSCASPRTGPRAAELHRRRHSFRSAFHMDVFERQKKKVFLFSFLGVSAIVLVSSLPFLWNCV